jgi:hypothetical protein
MKEKHMKKIAVFIFVFLLFLSVNGNTTELFSLDLELFDPSSKIVPVDADFLHGISSVEVFFNHLNRIISSTELKPGLGAVAEPITMLILGAGLVGLGALGRKRFKK